jgi:hypothetical protein
LIVPPQPSGAVPQVWPDGHVVAGVHPHALGVPPPPHVCGAGQVPQLIVPPQPSEMTPHWSAAGQAVIGVQH